jgi:Family of unknown function (DUF6325)
VSIGPVEYIIIGFPGNNFKGDIVPALAKLIDSETVRIIDLVFILKDPDGNVTTFEFDQLEELSPYATLQGEVGGLVNQEDIAYAADGLEPNSSAALLVWEDTWATELAEAVRGAGVTTPQEESLCFAALEDLAAQWVGPRSLPEQPLPSAGTWRAASRRVPIKRSKLPPLSKRSRLLQPSRRRPRPPRNQTSSISSSGLRS